MKLKSFVVTLVFLFSGTVFADPAIVIMVDNGCAWGDGERTAVGDVTHVINDGDVWILACEGTLVEGDPPKRALVGRSTEEEPLATCWTPFGETQDFHLNLTPSGRSKITCWGRVGE